jgi:RimJ/RimL family protein N-acetyltransferase
MLRDATMEDYEFLLELRNDHTVIATCFNASKVSGSRHLEWLKETLSDPNCRLLIVTVENKDIGQIRINIANGKAELSISLISSERGKGYGKAAIQKAILYINKSPKVKAIIARIKPENRASLQMFNNAGLRTKYIEMELKTNSK